MYTVVMRRALARLFSNMPLTEAALIAIRNEFRLLEQDITQRISKISEILNESKREPEDDLETEQNLGKFAMILLSALIDQTYSIICHPILRSPVGYLWPNMYSK
jgi:hypothetical protein